MQTYHIPVNGYSLAHDAADGNAWNGGALAAFISTSASHLAERLKRAADLDVPFASTDARELRSLLETFIDSRRVWQEQLDSRTGA